MNWKYKLEGHEAVPVEDPLEGAEWFETADRVVARTEIAPEIFVSTVFLGLDHHFGYGRPLLFETKTFGVEPAEVLRRYESWDEAEAGHREVVESMRN